jgi:hypothetical protein
MEEESKAIQEVAKTTGKVVDAAREAGGFIARFVAGPLEQGVGIFEDRLKYSRWERQVRLMQRADQFLRESGLDRPNKAVPLKLAVPLLQGAILEDDNELQDRWAVLLVNAGNADFEIEIRRAHLAILEQINSLEAKILDAIYKIPYESMQHEGVITANLPSSARVPMANERDLGEPSPEVVLALSNLARLGCIRAGATFGGGEYFARINPTMLGFWFVQACQLRRV